MSRPRFIAALGLGLAAFLAMAAAPAGPLAPPPTRDWVKILFEAMKAPVPPRRLVGDIYYVGASGVSSFLITTPAGHILLDTGFEDTVPLIQRSVALLGFKLEDIRIILSSHAHVDHVGGHALMKKLTGARVFASAADAQVLASGGLDDFLPFPRDTKVYAPVAVDQIVADGEQITLGGVTLTAHLTPGHTRGATTWSMDVSEAGRTYHVVFFCSLTINPGVRLLRNASYPGIAQDYETAFARLKALPCDIFFGPHPIQFGMADKFARMDRGEGVEALVDPAGWHNLLAVSEKAYRDQLAAEKAAAP